MTPLGIGAKALRYWETRQAVSSNNLANLSTPGFKAERVFARLLEDASITTESGTDLSAGALNPTDRPLDVAIVGDGFLVAETPEGPRWTRGGSLSLDADGRLVDGAGHPILGRHGEIVLPVGSVEIERTGEIKVDGALIDQFRVERPRNQGQLERAGANLWIPADEVMDVPEHEEGIRQGHLEESNVDAVGAMVEMIEIQRAYAAIQRTMMAEDEVNQTITTEIGRVR